jgi:hypothetical protein
MFSIAWPSENIPAFRPMSEGASPELSTGPLFFLFLFFYFRAKKTVLWQRFKYGYGEQSRHYGEQSRVKSEQSRVKSEQSRVKRVDKTEARL